MTIKFEGVTNRPYMMVMCCNFQLSDGTEIVVSSDYISFGLSELDENDVKTFEMKENGESDDIDELFKFEMTWNLCYVLDPNSDEDDILYYFTPRDKNVFNGANLIAFLLHGDTDDEYYVRFTRFIV